MKKILIKIELKFLQQKKNKLDSNNLRKLSNEISKLKITHKYQCIVVSSGAIISGSEYLGLHQHLYQKNKHQQVLGNYFFERI